MNEYEYLEPDGSGDGQDPDYVKIEKFLKLEEQKSLDGLIDNLFRIFNILDSSNRESRDSIGKLREESFFESPQNTLVRMENKITEIYDQYRDFFEETGLGIRLIRENGVIGYDSVTSNFNQEIVIFVDKKTKFVGFLESLSHHDFLSIHKQVYIIKLLSLLIADLQQDCILSQNAEEYADIIAAIGNIQECVKK